MLNCLQAAELRRLNAERAQQQLDVSRVEAEDQEVVVRNNALNKQQAALQAEVRMLYMAAFDTLLTLPSAFLQVRNLKQGVNQASDAASQAKFDLSALQQEGEQLRDQVWTLQTDHRMLSYPRRIFKDLRLGRSKIALFSHP